MSAPILAEYRTVLSRPELQIRKGSRHRFLQLISGQAHLVSSAKRVTVAADQDDSIFIEFADSARADYLVTGNQRHFSRFWKQTKIITS